MPPKVVAVAAGEAHTLALTGDGEVYSWGRGMFGRLGTGREGDELVPTAVAPVVTGRARPRFVAVAAGAYHSLALDGGLSMMMSINDIPILKGENYGEWHKKLDLFFTLAGFDWVLHAPVPKAPVEPVREENETDAAWSARELAYKASKDKYDIEHAAWSPANKKCLAVVKNTIEVSIMGSITDCPTVIEYLEKIKSQYTGSSKTYATQLIKQLVTERYTGGGIREHIHRMVSINNKLKPMDLAFKDDHIVHLVFASLPKTFDTFIVNYNMSPEKWDIEKAIAMCVQEEERLPLGSINLVKNKNKNGAPGGHPSPSKGKGPLGRGQYYKGQSSGQSFGQSSGQSFGQPSQGHSQQHRPRDGQVVAERDQCMHCFDRGHYKKDCPKYLKMIMEKKGIPFDENHSKKRKAN